MDRVSQAWQVSMVMKASTVVEEAFVKALAALKASGEQVWEVCSVGQVIIVACSEEESMVLVPERVVLAAIAKELAWELEKVVLADSEVQMALVLE